MRRLISSGMASGDGPPLDMMLEKLLGGPGPAQVVVADVGGPLFDYPADVRTGMSAQEALASLETRGGAAAASEGARRGVPAITATLVVRGELPAGGRVVVERYAETRTLRLPCSLENADLVGRPLPEGARIEPSAASAAPGTP